MRMMAVRLVAFVFGATLKVNVPPLVKRAFDVIETKAESLVAVQPQLPSVLTVTLPLPPLALKA